MSSVILAGDTSGTITLQAPAVAGTSVLTLPITTDTLIGLATTDTLTNKTLTSPILITPALGTPTSGVMTNVTGTASGLTAGNVTTNANLTGAITSVGNATSVAAQTGTGSTFVMQASPTLTTPDIGTPSAGVVTNLTGTASININGTVGATTPAAGAFTTLSATGVATFTAAGGIVLNRTNANTALIWQNNTVEKLRITNRGDASDVIQFSVANATVDALTFTQAGAVTIPGTLGVTGTLSATGAVVNAAPAISGFPLATQYVSGQNLFVGTPNTAGGIRIIAANNALTSGVNLELQGTQVNLWGPTTLVASVSSTGLAVTGTLSNTTGANFATSSGSVGIGTTSPGARLDVRVARTSGTNTNAIYLSDNVTGVQTSLFGTRIIGSSNADSAQSAIGFEAFGGTNNDTALSFYTQATAGALTRRMIIDSLGNVGIGTTSPSVKLDVARTGAGDIAYFRTTGNHGLGFSVDGSNNNQIANIQTNTNINYWVAGTGVQTFSTGGSEKVRIDATGNVGIGTTSPTSNLDVVGSDGTAGATSTLLRLLGNSGGTNKSGSLIFKTLNSTTTGTERISIIQSQDIDNNARMLALNPSGGDVTIGTTSAAAGKLTVRASGTENVGNQIANFVSDTSGDGVLFFLSNGTAHGNASLPTIAVNKNTATGRSINAEGTINASGADYAEYMTKSGNFTIAKGDVVGIDAQGKLTNVFANSVSFVVKSTDPSYVGGDNWGSEEVLGKRPKPDATQEEIDNFNIALEAVRALVDRIAFAGQVPVNVIGATSGQYIIPVNDNGAIKGQAVSNPTFEQYQSAVGKVIAIESDGRARIIVKVA